MQRYEYKVVPAPRRGEKARGVKSTEERFALALTTLMNAMGAEGWEYIRADILPCDERSGLTGTKTSFQNMLVFRRSLDEVQSAAPYSPALSAAGTHSAGSHSAAPVPVVAEPVPAAPVVPPREILQMPEAPEPAAPRPARLGAALGAEGASPAIGPASGAQGSGSVKSGDDVAAE